MTTVAVFSDSPSGDVTIPRQLFPSKADVISPKVVDAAELNDIDVAVLGISGKPGLDLLKQIREADPCLPVVVVADGARSETAITAMQIGAYNYLVQPIDGDEFRTVIAAAVDNRRLMQQPCGLKSGNRKAPELQMIGRCPRMLRVFKDIGRVAAKDVTVLITGESGTGKELVARAIHRHSARREQPFLGINCAALPDQLLESELFGHERGAFTGATQRRLGKFEECSGGTIFLDEIGDMSTLVQSKVLRLLQDQRFERVGGNETIETEVRIIAATNRDLDALTRQGKFRSDLFYRLNGFAIELPPLRERGDDVLDLLQHYFDEYAEKLGRRDVIGMAQPTVDRLLDHDWPGNVRELQSVVRQSLLNSSGPVIGPESLPEDLQHEMGSDAEPAVNSDLKPLLDRMLQQERSGIYEAAMELMEQYVLTRVLQQTGGNQSQAAKLLGITRGKVHDRLRQYGIGQRVNVVTAPRNDRAERTAAPRVPTS